MNILMRLFCVAAFAIALPAAGQIAPARTWPELKDAVQDRVNRNAYPLTGYDKEEVREALSRITSLDRDEWARSWMQQGEKHFAQAKAADECFMSSATSFILPVTTIDEHLVGRGEGGPVTQRLRAAYVERAEQLTR
jgi:hypothetical protein